MKWLIVALAMLIIAILFLSTGLSTSYGAVILIGPVPIVVASDVSIAFFLLLLTIVFLVFLLILNLLVGESLKPKDFEYVKPEELKPGRAEKRYGGLVLIGPLPIIFGEARMAIVASFLALILMILAFVFMFGWLR